MTPKPKQTFKHACEGKNPFGSFKLADQAAKRMRQNHEDGCAVEAYHCQHCGKYHTGQARRRWKRFQRAKMLEAA